MGRLSENFEIGNIDELSTSEMVRRIEEMYTQLARAINQKPDLVVRTSNGSASETFLSNGTININTSSNKVEILTNHPTPQTVTWITIS